MPQGDRLGLPSTGRDQNATLSPVRPTLLLPTLVLTVLGCSEARTPDGGPNLADAPLGMEDAPSDTAASDGAAPLDTPLLGDTHEVLFVGNSYVYVNDVPGHYRALTGPLFGTLRVEEVTTGGYTLAQHAMDARTDGTPLARALRTGTPSETAFDFVVLQEQSQIGGFPDGFSDRMASLAAASELAALITARGASVVLYLTWGRERGDELNPGLYPTFTAMQDLLDAGYLGMAARLRTEGATVRVAPVGGGFRLVFEDVVARGADPLAEGSDFDALYEPDGSHPSPHGAYLAACILAGTTTMADVRAFGDDAALGEETSARLRDACARALSDPRWESAP